MVLSGFLKFFGTNDFAVFKDRHCLSFFIGSKRPAKCGAPLFKKGACCVIYRERGSNVYLMCEELCIDADCSENRRGS